jgi:hypothetical protein
MLEGSSAPQINDRCICIVNRDSVVLAALISSFLYEPVTYLPLFLFPPVKSFAGREGMHFSDEYVSNLQGGNAGILINNAWATIGPREHVILGGLNDQQKSFLRLPDGVETIDIQKEEDVTLKLAAFAQRKSELRCKSSNILNALVSALWNDKKLVIDENAPSDFESPKNNERRGLVVVERIEDASPVVAINFARSVSAQTIIVDSLAKGEGRKAQWWIQEWKEKDDESGLVKLKEAVLARVGDVSFDQYEYATFFTEGLPYSFVIANVIPCSHVNLSIRPDLLVLNNIIFASAEPFKSAVVFSPVFFEDEETHWLCEFFEKSKYYCRALIGRQATLANFDFHAQFFPYDFLHICSHGGEVEGYKMTDKFLDKDGKAHVVEFEEVIGYTPVPEQNGIVEVIKKAFPRKLDGFAWMSEELEKQDFPSHVYSGMWDCIFSSKGRRTKIDQVSMSCHIACVDSIHQGQFHTLASHSSPLVFNNACWSWDEVAGFFFDCGARGYIGTLWAIDNQDAVTAAKVFYEHVFSSTVLEAFHMTTKALKATNSKDIYLYWGLHFTKVFAGTDPEESRRRVRKELLHAATGWAEKITHTKSAEVKRNSIRVLAKVLNEIHKNFADEASTKLERELRSNISVAPRSTSSISSDTNVRTQKSLTLAREYRKTKEQQ